MNKKIFIFGFLYSILLMLILSGLSYSLFFEFGNQSTITFRIEDTTGRIVASDRTNTSTLGFSGEDLLVRLKTGNGTSSINPSDDVITCTIPCASDSNFNANDLETSRFRCFGTCGGFANRELASYFKFNNFQDALSVTDLRTVTVTSASLFLHAKSTGGNITVHHVFSNQTWNETGLTFENQPCASTGTSIKLPPNSCNSTSEILASILPNSWNSIDITSMTRRFFAENGTNFSMILKGNTTCASGSCSVSITYENGEDQSGLAPYLLLVTNVISASSFQIRDTADSTACLFYTNGNFSCKGNLSMSSDAAWVTPALVSDIDKENIESDLNTFVDIAGDNMTGPLQILGNNLNVTGNITISQGQNLTAYSQDGTKWKCGPNNSGSFVCSQ